MQELSNMPSPKKVSKEKMMFSSNCQDRHLNMIKFFFFFFSSSVHPSYYLFFHNFKFNSPSQPLPNGIQYTRPDGTEKTPVVLVFYIGGVTHSEISAMRFISKNESIYVVYFSQTKRSALSPIFSTNFNFYFTLVYQHAQFT